jgi:hypothetical protein
MFHDDRRDPAVQIPYFNGRRESDRALADLSRGVVYDDTALPLDPDQGFGRKSLANFRSTFTGTAMPIALPR